IQMVNHGLSTGALFLLVGMIYERRHTRLIADFGGLWSVVPAFSALFMVVVLSSLGLPGLNGFVGEFLVLVGAFQTSPWLAAVATSGIVFAAVYLLWMYQRVIFGEVTHQANRSLPDLSPREWALLVPVVVCYAAALILLLSMDYLRRSGAESGEYYALVLFATAGMMLLAAAGDLVVLFLALELMSLSLYVLAGLFTQALASSEASMKYFILGAFASSFLL